VLQGKGLFRPFDAGKVAVAAAAAAASAVASSFAPSPQLLSSPCISLHFKQRYIYDFRFSLI
jgi:hypothetical protein